VCAVVLAAQLVHYSPLKPMWIDEILTYYQVADKSPADAVASLDTGVNLLPPGYFILLASTLKFVEFSPLVARALSCGFIILTIPVMLLTLRRTVGVWFAMMSVGAVVFTSPLLLFHNSEARPYGMTLFLVALVSLAFVKTAGPETPSRGTWALLVIANALVATSTYFGGLYSFLAFAATIFLDWQSDRFRPRVYLGYVIGWVIFAAAVLPLCLHQLAANGAAGTEWLPSFAYAWRHLAKLWSGILIWTVPVIIALGAILWVGRSQARLATDTPGARNFSPVRPLAALSILWVLLPIAFIVQARITGHNVYFDRYFIGSEIGVMIAIGLIPAWFCWRFGGSLKLENAFMRGPVFGAVAKVLITVFICAAAFDFYYRAEPAQMGSNAIVTRANQWALPKATFDRGIYTEGFYQPSGGNSYWYIASSDREASALARFRSTFQIKRTGTLADFHEFLFIDSDASIRDFNLEAWAKSRGYHLSRVGEYRDREGRSKGFYLVQSDSASAVSHL